MSSIKQLQYVYYCWLYHFLKCFLTFLWILINIHLTDFFFPWFPSNISDTFNNKVSLIMGNWRRVKFWKDRWCKEDHLYISFPFLCSLAATKEAWVLDLWEQTGERDCWNLCFTRNLNDLKLENIHQILMIGSLKTYIFFLLKCRAC